MAPSARDVTYEQIQGLLAEQRQEGQLLQCTFRCTISGESIEASVPIAEGSNKQGMMQRVQGRAKRGAWYSFRRSLLRKLSRLLGRGFLGRMVYQFGGEMLDTAYDKVEHTYSDKQKRAAAVRAFEQVAQSWRWDESMRQWVWAQPAEAGAGAAR